MIDVSMLLPIPTGFGCETDLQRIRESNEAARESQTKTALTPALVLPTAVIPTPTHEMGMVYNVPILVASSFSDRPGTLIHEEANMNTRFEEIRNRIRGIATDTNVAKITVIPPTAVIPTPTLIAPTPTELAIADLSEEISVFEVRDGDCLNLPVEVTQIVKEFESTEIVPCNGQWEYRVISSFTVSNSTRMPDDEYFTAQATLRCDRRYTIIIQPTLESWSSEDRTVNCLQERYGLPTSQLDRLDTFLHITNLHKGECFNEIEDYAELVPCTGKWELRVLSKFLTELSGAYPGVDYFGQKAIDKCDPNSGNYLYPSLETWEFGDRIVMCFQKRGELHLRPKSSVRGSRDVSR